MSESRLGGLGILAAAKDGLTLIQLRRRSRSSGSNSDWMIVVQTGAALHFRHSDIRQWHREPLREGRDFAPTTSSRSLQPLKLQIALALIVAPQRQMIRVRELRVFGQQRLRVVAG